MTTTAKKQQRQKKRKRSPSSRNPIAKALCVHRATVIQSEKRYDRKKMKGAVMAPFDVSSSTWTMSMSWSSRLGDLSTLQGSRGIACAIVHCDGRGGQQTIGLGFNGELAEWFNAPISNIGEPFGAP